MKPFTTLAAALILTFGTAAANAQTVKGNIPFGFTVAHKDMAAGTYTVEQVSRVAAGEPLIVRNVNDNSAVIAGVMTHAAVAKGEAPRLEFLCGAGNCRLVRLYTRTDKWEIAQPARNKAEKERIATVYLSTDSAH